MQHWSWIWAAAESALQAQNLMHWTAFGFGLGIAAYFGVPREPGPLVFVAASLSAGLCVGPAIRFRTGIARLLIVIAALAGGYAWSKYRAHAVSGPLLSERFYGAVQGRVVGIDRSLSEKPRLTLDQLVLGSLPQPPGPAEPYGYDFQRQAWFAQLGAVGYTRSPVMFWRAAPADQGGLIVQKWRQKIGAHMAAHMPAHTAGVAVAITVGDRMYLDREVQQTLRAANLSHFFGDFWPAYGLAHQSGVLFNVGLFVVSALSYFKLADQENSRADEHRGWGGVSDAVRCQCCDRAGVYYGLYHLRSGAARAACDRLACAGDCGNVGFAAPAGGPAGSGLSNVICSHWPFDHRV
ncbi:hypothetical protein IMCC1933_08630 [Rhodobacteraceae bacterium IMCC1933]|nr:hypothetical protein [Rhodobacteraceae bacterium IMCC1923]MDP4067323.1 hypothetical protein [Rhodobacteraceae bacterium IMCC1933]MDP4070523.1 hypothetical protein [Rhodobacteraceae bacterium IMCC1909]